MKTTSQLTLAQILAVGHAPEQAPHVLALCRHLDCQPDKILAESFDHYGLPQYEVEGHGMFAIGTDDEATQATVANIRDSVWAFNASFILGECGLPAELEDAITAFQQEKCEDANDALLALVEKCCVSQSLKTGIVPFAESAIAADGRGHFLSSYDGEENEETVEMPEGDSLTFYLYRTN